MVALYQSAGCVVPRVIDAYFHALTYIDSQAALASLALLP